MFLVVLKRPRTSKNEEIDSQEHIIYSDGINFSELYGGADQVLW